MVQPIASCPRCGLRRHVHSGRSDGLCVDCKTSVPVPTDRESLPAGMWVQSVGGVWTFEPTTGRKLRPCGTLAAYRRHLRDGETPCVPCSNASRDYTRKARGIEVPKPLEPHGTHAAYQRHYHGKTPYCDPCIQAERAYQRAAKRSIRERKAA